MARKKGGGGGLILSPPPAPRREPLPDGAAPAAVAGWLKGRGPLPGGGPLWAEALALAASYEALGLRHLAGHWLAVARALGPGGPAGRERAAAAGLLAGLRRLEVDGG